MFLAEHWDDICSDMSVFHRLGPPIGEALRKLDGPTFWKLAWRLGAYQGRMAAVIAELRDQLDSPASGHSGQPQPTLSAARADRGPAVEGTAEMLTAHPAFAAQGPFAALFSVAKIPADAE